MIRNSESSNFILAKAKVPKEPGVIKDELLSPDAPPAQAPNLARWLVKHLQWDFDDVDPLLPLSPYLRFDYSWTPPVTPWPLQRNPVSFTTNISPTRPEWWTSASVAAFPHLTLSGIVCSDPEEPLAMPSGSCGAEVTMELQRALDGPLNHLLDISGFPLVARTQNQAFLGVRTSSPPCVGLASSLHFRRDAGLPFAGLRARISKDLEGRVRYTASLF